MNVLKNCRNGLFVYNTNDVYIGRSLTEYGEFSSGEAELFEEFIKPGMTVLDIGANIGCHTVTFARLVKDGVVFAFEPQRLSYYLLCANIALNNLTNVYCLNNAVSSQDGRMDICELDYTKENNFGGLEIQREYAVNANKCSVKVVKLDNFNFNKVDFIKIDVEGMEPDVLKGSFELLKQYRPLIYLENDRPENMSLLVKLLKSQNYEMFFHAPPLYNSNNFLRNANNIFGTTTSINMLAYPKEKPIEVNPKLNLTPLNEGGKVFLHKDPKNNQDLHESITNDVIKTCINASVYYSEILYEHERGLAFAEIAMRVNPEDYQGYYQTAMVFCKMCNYEMALKFIDVALEKNPNNYKTHLNRATILGGLGRYNESIEQYRKALTFQNSPSCHFYLACSLITVGNLEEGWNEYEWRYHVPKVQQFTRLLPNAPHWNGEDLNDKKILLYCEQGSGDAIQFVRYAKSIKNLGAHVTVACTHHLTKLFANTPGIDNIIAFNSDDESLLNENFDYVFSLLSLPRFFGLDKTKKYIIPTKKELPCKFNNKKFNVGIVWAGNDMHEHDYARSCHLKHFEFLKKYKNVDVYSLQKGNQKRVWSNVGRVDLLEGSNFELLDYTNTFEDFNDTANFIRELDLVITVDTSIAHIAAAMGKPTWVLLGFYPDYRWMTERTDTPWYPSIKLFRQHNYGKNWDNVFEDIEKEFKELLR